MNNFKHDNNCIISYLHLKKRAGKIVEILDRSGDFKNIITFIIDLNMEESLILAEEVAEIYAQKLTRPQLLTFSDYLKKVGTLITSKEKGLEESSL